MLLLLLLTVTDKKYTFGKHINKPPTTVTETINTGKPEIPNQTLHDND